MLPLAGSGSLGIGALSEWHLGEIASCQAHMDEAISIAKEQVTTPVQDRVSKK